MIRASQILFWFGLSIAASIALYHTSDRTRELDRQLRNLNTAIDAEQQSLHVLRAEWVYLTNPARIEVQAKKHLNGMNSSPTHQVVTLADLDDALPTRDQEMAAVAVSATPIASLESTIVTPLPAAAPTPAVAVPSKKPKTTTTSKQPRERRIAAVIDRSHINNRMVIGNTAQTASATGTSHDPIGAYIHDLRSRQ